MHSPPILAHRPASDLLTRNAPDDGQPRRPSSAQGSLLPPSLHFTLLNDDDSKGKGNPDKDLSQTFQNRRHSSPLRSRQSSISVAVGDTNRQGDQGTPCSDSSQFLNPRASLYHRSQSLYSRSSVSISDDMLGLGPEHYPRSVEHSRRSSVGSMSVTGVPQSGGNPGIEPRVIKRHIKFMLALYISSIMIMIPKISTALGTLPFLSNIAVVFMHPARTVGSQLEVTVFSIIGAILAAAWIIPCQLSVVAYNKKYLTQGGNAGWIIQATWFFIGIWIMTTFKIRYPKLNGTFIIYTVIGTFAVTHSHKIVTYSFRDFLNQMAPLMLGVGITLFVSILCWPEYASEDLGRALNESMDTSRALLNLSTRSFLLNHKVIALPKSVFDKAQEEVREAQAKLYTAYGEARYEVSFALRNPADYKEARAVVSNLMRHLASMSLVVQNERLLMLGHPDRDDADLISTNKKSMSSDSSDADNSTDSSDDSNGNDETHGLESRQKSTPASVGCGLNENSQSPPEWPHNAHQRRRSSAGEIQRVRQLLLRAEKSAEQIMNERRSYAQSLSDQRAEGVGSKSAPISPGGVHGRLVPDNTLNFRNHGIARSFKSILSTKSSTKFKSDRSPPKTTSPSLSCVKNQGGEIRRCRSEGSVFGGSSAMAEITLEATRYSLTGHLDVPASGRLFTPSIGRRSVTERQFQDAAMALKNHKRQQLKLEQKAAERAARAENAREAKMTQTTASARAIPPKEVAFGDRKLFMSFLNIVREPIQRLSDTCSKAMVSMETDMASGLNVESDRKERIKRRKIARTESMRCAEKFNEKCAENIAPENTAPLHTDFAMADNTTTEPAAASTREPEETSKKDQTSRWRKAMKMLGVGQRTMTQEELDYAGTLRAAQAREDDEKNHNLGLQRDPARVAASSADDGDDELAMLPPGISCVQYLTQELEHFDRLETTALQEFIKTHPTLEVGPREEIFLIFFFLFALREIARELLRLGQYIETMEERERMQMYEQNRRSRSKRFWWPKVINNFWQWFEWSSFTQLKASEGYTSAMMTSTRNLEHKQKPMSVKQELARARAKAKTARLAEELAAQRAAKVAAERAMEQRRRRASEDWDLPSLRKSATISHIVRRGDVQQERDLENSGHSQEPISTRLSPVPSHGVLKNWESTHPPSVVNSARCEGRHPSSPDMDPIQSSGEGLAFGQGSEPAGADSGFPDVDQSSNIVQDRAKQYTVVQIPSYHDLPHDRSVEYPRISSTLSPKVRIVRRTETSPLEGTRDRRLTNATLVGQGSMEQPVPSDTSLRILFPRVETAPSFDTSNSSSSASDNTDPGFHARTRSRSAFAMIGRRRKDLKPNQKCGHDQHSPLSPSVVPKKEHQIQQMIKEAEASEPVQRTVFINIPKPKTWRYRLWEWIQPLKSDEVKFGFKMAVALSIIGLWSWLDWDNALWASDRGQWAMTTVMAVLSPTVGATFSVCGLRIAGTVLGCTWALATYMALPLNPYVICAMMLILTFTVAFLILESKHPLIGVIMMLSYSSVIFISYLGQTDETIWGLCYKQGVTVILGILISVIMNAVLWPTLARRELRKEIALLVGRQGVFFAELVNKFLLEHHQSRDCMSMDDEVAESDAYSADDSQSQSLNQSQSGSASEAAIKIPAYNNQQDGNNAPDGYQVNQNLQHYSPSSPSSNKILYTACQNSTEEDRQAFQHVENQLQTKLIKISRLLDLSAMEPRLKEKFPIKLYAQIVQCCQNILDRMVSMRMAAQMLSPVVRDLVTGPMNYFRRDMMGALLLYFSVLSSSLASKTPLPPYLPSARMARLKVIYNVRIAIEEHQRRTSQNQYTYIYYYAFSSALEEVIEELELLAILIKPIVGVTLVSSGDAYAYGFQGHQMYRDPSLAQLGLPLKSDYGLDESSPFSGMNSGNGPLCGDVDSVLNSGSSQHQQQQQQKRECVNSRRDIHPEQRFDDCGDGSLTQSQQQQQRHQSLSSEGLSQISRPTTQESAAFNTQGSLLTQQTPSSMLAGPSTGPSSYVSVPSIMEQLSFSSATGSPIFPQPRGVAPIDVPVLSRHPLTAISSPVIVMDENNLLRNRYGQRFKDAILTAQDAAGQQVIEVSSPVLLAATQHAQLPRHGAGAGGGRDDVGVMEAQPSSESPMVSGMILPSGTVSSLSSAEKEEPLRKRITHRFAEVKERFMPGKSGGEIGVERIEVSSHSHYEADHAPDRESHSVEKDVSVMAGINQTSVDANRAQSDVHDEDVLVPLTLPPSAIHDDDVPSIQ
ncbi:hypothetical protein BG004_004437 [Podila humilis]|nr:hypothetical protein BG004_004437 [Podila humilis]